MARLASGTDHEREELSREVDRLKELLSDADQAAAIALDRQVTTAVERVRAELTAESDKLRLEIESLTKQRDYANRLLAESEQAAAIALERQVAAAVEQLRAELDEEHRALMTIQKNAADQMRTEFAVERDKLRHEIDHLRQAALRALEESREPVVQPEIAAAPSPDGQPEHVRVFSESLKRMSSVLEREVASAVNRGVLELVAEMDRLRRDLEQVADYASRFEGDQNRLTPGP